MNNEPVAYRHLHEDGWEYYDAPTGEDCKDCIPLYTHPAKTLTDEEIENIAYKVFEMGDGKEVLFDFAKAILRKASEK